MFWSYVVTIASTNRESAVILQHALFAIITCLWTTQHLNVPAQPHQSQNVWRARFDRFMKSSILVVAAIIFPEFWLGRAWADHRAAAKSLKNMNRQDWSWSHAFFANMGGFVLQVPNDLQSPSDVVSDQATTSQSVPITSSESGARQRIFRTSQPQIPSTVLTPGSQFLYINADQLHFLCQRVQTKAPTISTDIINDKSKTDPLMKALTLGHVMTLCCVTAYRYLNSLAISHIELVALAYSAFSIASYALWWGKPQDVRIPIIITLSQAELDHEGMTSNFLIKSLQYYSELSYFSEEKRQDLRLPIPNDADYDIKAWETDWDDWTYLDLGMICGSLFLGVTHVLAWNFPFPCAEIQILWNIAAVTSTVALPLLAVLSGCISYSNGMKGRDPVRSRAATIRAILNVVLIILYISSRFCLLIISCAIFPYDSSVIPSGIVL